MKPTAATVDYNAYCLQQLQRFLARAEAGRLTLIRPCSDGRWLHLRKAHFHTTPELFLQPSGSTQFAIPSGRFLLRAGQLCLLPAGLPHKDLPVSGRAAFRHMVVLLHSPRELSVHLTLPHPTNTGRYAIVFGRRIQGPTADSLRNYYDDLLAAPAGRYPNARTRGLLIALLALLLENWTAPATTAPPENIKITHCKQLVSTRLGDPELSVADMARQIGCSPDYLSGLFHRECGTSLVAYLTSARMERSLFLLRHTAMSIKEIAAACGFSRPSYFIHVFHRRQGASPLQYRAALRSAGRAQQQPVLRPSRRAANLL